MVKAKNFEVEYSHDGTNGRLTVAAADIAQALVAARLKLTLQRKSDFVLTAVWTMDEPVPVADGGYVDPLEGIALLAEISYQVMSASDVSPSIDEHVLVYSCLALVDNGRPLPSEFISDFERLYEGPMLPKWNVDVYDEDRPLVSIVEATDTLAYAFIDKWCTAHHPLDYYDVVPRDPDIDVDFENNVTAYCFLLAARAHIASSSTPDALLRDRYEKVLPRFLKANNLRSLEEIDLTLMARAPLRP